MGEHTDLIARLREAAFWTRTSSQGIETSDAPFQAADALEAATRQDLGVSAVPTGPAGQGPEPVPVSAVPALVPDAVLYAVALAIDRASCPGREGPYGGYDYGHNVEFYGPAPVDGRYVVRDFRDPRSPTWGAWVHQTDDHDEHEREYARLTRMHIARAAIDAYAQGIEAGTAETPQEVRPEGREPGPKDAPNPSHSLAEQGEKKSHG